MRCGTDDRLREKTYNCGTTVMPYNAGSQVAPPCVPRSGSIGCFNQSVGPFYFQTLFNPSSMKRRTCSDTLIPVRFASFLSAVI